jgi:hypothetical protein
MCSCCKRIDREPEGWMELEDAAIRLKLFETSQSPELRYTICPTCAALAKNHSGSAA